MEKPFHSIRQQYSKHALNENQVDHDPLKQMHAWLDDAISAECPEPTAMVLSTAGQDNRPSSRVVLMKELDETGITFFTNYHSRKGLQLTENPFASILFFWPAVERQVRIEGVVSKIPEGESDIYFASRPEPSRISAIISPQSHEIPNREWLEQQRDPAVGTHTCVRSPNANLPPSNLPPLNRPSNWGGYRLVPDYFEFWQGRENRLHDRIVYRKTGSDWKISRLAP